MTSRLSLLRGFVLSLAACGGSVASTGATPDGGTDSATADTAVPVDTAVPAEQKLLFEAGYVNVAWGFTYSGLYVNAAGEVWSYEAPIGAPSIEVGLRAGMTEGEIAAKYASNAKLVAKVSKEELAARIAAGREAESGALTESYNCADYGQLTFVAWRFDPSTSRYSPTILGADGDQATRNTSKAAATVVDWLAGFGGRERSCKLETIACTGPSCVSTACKPGSGLVSACDGTCVVAGRCDTVSSCSVCQAPYQVCVLDHDGAAHCTGALGSATTTCESFGDRLCAGGKTWCAGSIDAGFRCERLPL